MPYQFRGKWRATVRLAGRRFTKIFHTHREAKEWEVRAKAGSLDRPEADKPVPTFRDLCEQWYELHCLVNKAPSQWKEDRSVMKNHLWPAFGEIKLDQLNALHLERLKADINKGRKPKTVNNVLNLAKTIMNRAVDWSYVERNPFQTVKLLRVSDQPFDFWTIEERERFLATARLLKPEFAEVVAFACHTGLRLGEIRGLKRDCIDFSALRITVRRSFCHKQKCLNEFTKSREIGWVPMNAAVTDILAKRKEFEPEEFVFKEFVLDDPTRTIAWIAKKAKVKPIRFHDLRHTYASCLVMAGEDLYVVMKLMRHSEISMTQRYTHLAPEFLKGKTDSLMSSNTHGGTRNLRVIK